VSVKPVLAGLSDQADHEGLTRVYTAATRWTLTLNIPFFLVSVLYPHAILAIFGESFASGATALILLAVGEVVVAGTGICGSIIDMTGHTRLKLVNTVVWIALLLVCNVLLIPRWGLVGAATASLIATATINIIRLVEVWVVERLTPYRDGFWKPVLAATTALSAGLMLRAALPVDDAIGVAVVQGTLVVALYAGLIMWFGFAPEDRLVFARAAHKLERPLSRIRPRRRRPEQELAP
ncbi:MAG TPA: polysaccharide biosynthesis C-terminal domain-containing protein, partial [Euzebyales bacterium]|nr:polysaccharide biosynthesis C-terminal domain-containing protein [Euzebyales bacterium]